MRPGCDPPRHWFAAASAKVPDGAKPPVRLLRSAQASAQRMPARLPRSRSRTARCFTPFPSLRWPPPARAQSRTTCTATPAARISSTAGSIPAATTPRTTRPARTLRTLAITGSVRSLLWVGLFLTRGSEQDVHAERRVDHCQRGGKRCTQGRQHKSGSIQ